MTRREIIQNTIEQFASDNIVNVNNYNLLEIKNNLLKELNTLDENFKIEILEINEQNFLIDNKVKCAIVTTISYENEENKSKILYCCIDTINN